MPYDTQQFLSTNGQVIFLDPKLIQIEVASFDAETGERVGYQRERSPIQVADAITKQFDPKLFDYPVISRRSLANGWTQDKIGDWAIDGQGRVLAVRDLGITQIPCRVLFGLNRVEEVAIYCALQDNRKNLTPAQRYAAQASVPESWQARVDKMLVDKFKIFIGAKKSVPTGLKNYQLTTALTKLNDSCTRWNSRTQNQNNKVDVVLLIEQALTFLISSFPNEDPINTASLEAVGSILLATKEMPKLATQVTFADIRKSADDIAAGSSGKKASAYRETIESYL